MRLRQANESVPRQIWEFDVWVTPSIVDIRETPRFQEELGRIVDALEVLADGMPDASSRRYAAELVNRVFQHLDGLADGKVDDKKKEAVLEFLFALSALLFLVTGKSDNNQKCQFPLFLKQSLGWTSLPRARLKNGVVAFTQDNIPRVLDSESYMARIRDIFVCSIFSKEAGARDLAEKARLLLFEFVQCLLVDSRSRDQLSAFVEYYNIRKQERKDPTVLLVPLVIFQVRGSVSASGGHEPEEILRRQMTVWGLIRDTDFNSADVVLDVKAGRILELEGAADEEAPVGTKIKTRAYDFVLPYKTPTWTPRVFVQSQFYAGDSGSVSHKNVDQTRAARQSATEFVRKAWPNGPPPRFMEFVDGAGYCASLNGDLRSLLSFEDTAGFFQIRSAPIRLRRELQDAGFLTPLEIAHAALRSQGQLGSALELLTKEGYHKDEISRALESAVRNGYIVKRGRDNLSVAAAFADPARRHLLLDAIAAEGKEFPPEGPPKGVVLVPGFGPYFGRELGELERVLADKFGHIWPKGAVLGDLQKLAEDGFVLLR